MGWFGRKPRKVGFGVTEAKPAPSRPTKYALPKPAQVKRNRAWDSADKPSATQPAPSKSSGDDILHQRDTAPVIEETPAKPDADDMTRQQLEALKKRSPWLGTLAEKMVAAQAKARVGSAKKHMAAPVKPKKSRLALIIIIFIAFFMLGPFMTTIIAMLGG